MSVFVFSGVPAPGRPPGQRQCCSGCVTCFSYRQPLVQSVGAGVYCADTHTGARARGGADTRQRSDTRADGPISDTGRGGARVNPDPNPCVARACVCGLDRELFICFSPLLRCFSRMSNLRSSGGEESFFVLLVLECCVIVNVYYGICMCILSLECSIINIIILI